MDQVQKQAQACGIAKATATTIFATTESYDQAIDTVQKKMATGQVDSIAASFFEQVVQQNIGKMTSTTTSKQAGKLLAKLRETLPKLEQQFLQQTAPVQNPCQEERPGRTTAKPNISLLKQAMCSMPLSGQLADATLRVGDDSDHTNHTVVQSGLVHGNQYKMCVNV